MLANGDIKTEADINRTVTYTGVDGVMAARGILQNPVMYAGFDETPLQCDNTDHILLIFIIIIQ